MEVEMKSPETKIEFKKYYFFRWKMLRAPFDQLEGTEKDSFEKNSFHIMLTSLKKIIGVGRIHITRNDTVKEAQIRYMAVDKTFQNKGMGSMILKELELNAIKNNVCRIILNARSSGIPFYEKNGYTVIKKSHLLFNKIQHFLMVKNISK